MQERFVMEEDCGVGTVSCESQGEYTLPDYMPEVRRVLRLDADATVAGQYENGDKVEVGGETRYTLLYTDTDGHIAASPLDGTFDAVVSVPSGTPLMVYPRMEGAHCRLGGPRRVSVKAGVTLVPHAYHRMEFDPPHVDEAVGKTEVLCHPMQTATTLYFHMSDVALTDTVKCEPDSKLLSCDGKVLLREVKCETNGVRVRGEVWVTSLCNNSEMTPYNISCKIPLDEFIPCDSVTPDFAGIARANCHTLTCNISSGEDGWHATFDTTLNIDGMAAINTEGMAVTDLYAMTYEVKPRTKTVTGRYYPVMQLANFTVDGGIPREEIGCEDTPKPVNTRASSVTANCSFDGSVITVEGEIRGNCILACEKQDGGYRSEGFHLPYRVRVNCASPIPFGTTITCDVQCISCRARGDGNRLAMDAELGLMLMGCCYDTVEVVTEAETDADAPITREKSEIVAVYLTDNDSLWSIGRKYHVPLADLAHANSLPEEVLSEPDYAPHLDGLSRLVID